jgi:hypothetical protein
MHRLAVKLITVLRRMLTSFRESPVITLAEVVTMVDVSVKMFRPMEPGSGSDEYTTCEPLRPVVSIRSTAVRRNFIIAIRTYRRYADAYRNLRRGSGRGDDEKKTRDSTEKEDLRFHYSPPALSETPAPNQATHFPDVDNAGDC